MTSKPNQPSLPTARLLTTLDSNHNTQMAGKQNLAEPGKGIVRRTRNALGDIGNRLTQKGAGATTSGMDKPGIVGKAAGAGTKASSSTTASGQAPIVRGTKLTRAISIQGTVAGRQVDKNAYPDRKKPVVRSKTTTTTSNLNLRERKVAPSATLVKIQEGFIPSKVEVAVRLPVPTSAAGGDSLLSANTVKEAVKEEDKLEVAQDLEIDLLSNAFSLQRFEVEDIEDIDAFDVGEFMLKEYVKDIDRYLFDLEKHYIMQEDFLKDRSVNCRMRAVLLDWIVDVHHQFGLCQETLYLAGRTLDRYLQLDKTVARGQLQLAGVTALFIAVKFEEVCVPTILDFSSVSDNAFTPGDIRNMESKMLKVLKFDLASPLPVVFLRRCSKALKIDMDVYMLSKLIVELSILDYNLCHIFPSMLAAASAALAVMVLNKVPITLAWTPCVVKYGRYTLSELKPVIKVLINTLSRPYEETHTRFQASLAKFARSKLMRISKLPELKAASWKVRVLAEVAKI